MPRVDLLAEAEEELLALELGEEVAMRTAMAKLEALGSRLPYPHQSAVRGAGPLRELRPRSGRSVSRAFYRQIGPELFAIGAIGPEALSDPPGFRRSVRNATDRLDRATESGD